MTAPIWVDIIEDIVDNVRADSDLPAITNGGPFYMHGHPLEVFNILAQKDRNKVNKFKKFPLIALFQDFTETMGDDMRIRSSASLNIIIAMNTSPDYDASQRYDNTFRTVLYPLYDLLLKHIVKLNRFSNVAPGLVPHDKTDRLFWGKNNEGVSIDHIDAIEIQNLRLDLNYKTGC